MQSHEWNVLDAKALMECPLRLLPDTGYTVRVAVSLASEDGVYTLDDLRHAHYGELPGELATVLRHLAEGTGVYDLADLRRELRALEGSLLWDELEDAPDDDGDDDNAPVRVVLSGVDPLVLRATERRWRETAAQTAEEAGRTASEDPEGARAKLLASQAYIICANELSGLIEAGRGRVTA